MTTTLQEAAALLERSAPHRTESTTTRQEPATSIEQGSFAIEFTEKQARESLAKMDAGETPRPSIRSLAENFGWHKSRVERLLKKIDGEKSLAEPPTATERRHMLIAGCKEFDKLYPPGPSEVATAEEAVDDAIAKGVVNLNPDRAVAVTSKKPDAFDAESDSMVIPDQPAIAVYENNFGAVVICQRGHGDYDEDPFIVVRPENVEKLIVRLRAVAKDCTS